MSMGRTHLHGGHGALGGLQQVVARAAGLHRRGGHGVALVNGLQRAARHLPRGVPRRLVRGRHQVQAVPQEQRALLQAHKVSLVVHA